MPLFQFLRKRLLGFTLIEIMVAMAILAILATAGLMAYSGYLKKGRDSSRAALASQVNTEVMNYAGGNGGKPPADADEFRQFLQSAGGSFGKSAAEISNGTILQDPLGGKEVCLDVNGVANQPCAFHYTAYEGGTYAISYGVEDIASMKTNFYRTDDSIPDPVTHTTPVTKYGVYIGTAPYIGGPVTTPQNNTAVDPPAVVITSFMSPRIDIVTVSGGSGGNIRGGGIACGITMCGVGQGCIANTCVNSCGQPDAFCAEGTTCVEGACMPPPTCGNGFTVGGYSTVRAKDSKCWFATNLGTTTVGGYGDYYQWNRSIPGWSGSNWDGTGTGSGDPCPAGSYTPTYIEWATVVAAEGITNTATAASSTLVLPAAGWFGYNNGSMVSNSGNYWSSNSYNTQARFLTFQLSFSFQNMNHRASGYSVRCMVIEE